MKVSRPVSLPKSALISSTALEPNTDPAAEIETAWSPTEACAVGDRRVYANRKWESLRGSRSLFVRAVRVLTRSVTQPAKPSGGTYNFSGNTLTPPAGWERDDFVGPLAGSGSTWASTQLFITSTPDVPIAGPTADPNIATRKLILQGASFVDTSPTAGAVTLVGNPEISAGPIVSPYPWMRFDGSADYVQVPASAAFNAGTGAICAETQIFLNSALGGTPQTIFAKTSAAAGLKEWSFFCTQDYAGFYYGTRGTNQAVIRLFWPVQMTLNAPHTIRVARDAAGAWGCWLDGVKGTQYQVAPLGISLVYGAVTTGTYTNAVDLGTASIPVTAGGNPVSTNLNGFLRFMRLTVATVETVGSTYTPLQVPWSDANGGWPTPITYTRPSLTGAALIIYRLVDGTWSDAPNGGTYNPATGVLTPPTGWSTTPLAPGQYAVGAAAVPLPVAAGSAPVAIGLWGTPFLYASAGLATMSLSNPVVLLQADNSGVVADYSAAVALATVVDGVTDETASWTFSLSVGGGVTAVLSSNQVSVSAVTNDVSNLWVSATRAGYPQQSRAMTLLKVKAVDSYSGPVSGLRMVAFTNKLGSASASVRFNTDGTFSVKQGASGSFVTAGNYVVPTSAGVGSGFWLKVTPRAGYTGASPGTSGTWVQLSAAQTFTETVTAAGEDLASFHDWQLSSSNTGTPVVATGTLDLHAVY